MPAVGHAGGGSPVAPERSLHRAHCQNNPRGHSLSGIGERLTSDNTPLFGRDLDNGAADDATLKDAAGSPAGGAVNTRGEIARGKGAGGRSLEGRSLG